MVTLARTPGTLLNGSFTKIHTYMAGFGKHCEKPTHIYGSGKWIRKLERPVPHGFQVTMQTTDVTVTKSGAKQFTGRLKELKKLQSYTEEFGQAVRDAFMSTRAEVDEIDFDWNSDEEITSDTWSDVKGEELCRYLRVPMRSPR